MSFDIAMSEVLTQLRNSVLLYEEIIRKLSVPENNTQNDTQNAKMIERLNNLIQQAQDLQNHLCANE